MKLLLLFLIPLFRLAQTEFNPVTMLSGKVTILAPKELKPMSDEMWAAKYQRREKPALALSDKDAEVNLLGIETGQSADDDHLEAFKDFQIQQLQKNRPELKLLGDGMKTVNGKKLGFFKFVTDAVDQKVFNYYFFVIVDGKVLFFTFNCIEKLQGQWEGIADKMIASLTVK